MSADNKRLSMTIYFTPEIYKAIDKIYKESKVKEKKNTIVLKCVIAGLKKEYNIDV